MSDYRNTRDFLILTNNPLVLERLRDFDYYTIRYLPDYSYRDILVQARNLIYEKHIFYTHPLAGSVKPFETPYKSVVVSLTQKKELDQNHVLLAAEAIETCDKFQKLDWSASEDAMRDFRLIDFDLLAGALDIK